MKGGRGESGGSRIPAAGRRGRARRAGGGEQRAPLPESKPVAGHEEAGCPHDCGGARRRSCLPSVSAASRVEARSAERSLGVLRRHSEAGSPRRVGRHDSCRDDGGGRPRKAARGRRTGERHPGDVQSRRGRRHRTRAGRPPVDRSDLDSKAPNPAMCSRSGCLGSSSCIPTA